MILAALTKVEDSVYRVYYCDDDWRILGPNFERWASVWQNDFNGSLTNALNTIPNLDLDNVDYCIYNKGDTP